MADQPTQRNIKVWRSSPESLAGFQTTEKAAYMVGDHNNFIVASNIGVTLSSSKGISLNTASENLRKGGLFIEMNDLVQMIPTTLVTPMPAQVPFPPLAMVTTIIKDMPMFLSMLGGRA